MDSKSLSIIKLWRRAEVSLPIPCGTHGFQDRSQGCLSSLCNFVEIFDKRVINISQQMLPQHFVLAHNVLIDET